MAGMPWIKVYTEMLDDVKMSRLTDAQKWRFVQLIILAGECDAGGALVTGESRVTHEEACWRLRCDAQTFENDITALIKCGLVTIENEVICVIKFNERQGPTQESKRKAWVERQERHRNKAKLENVTRDNDVSHATEEEERKRREEEEHPQPLNIFSLYENEIGGLTKSITDKLADAEKVYPAGWFELAFKEAASHNKRSWAYAEAILKRWSVEGVSSNGNGRKKRGMRGMEGLI